MTAARRRRRRRRQQRPPSGAEGPGLGDASPQATPTEPDEARARGVPDRSASVELRWREGAGGPVLTRRHARPGEADVPGRAGRLSSARADPRQRAGVCVGAARDAARAAGPAGREGASLTGPTRATARRARQGVAEAGARQATRARAARRTAAAATRALRTAIGVRAAHHAGASVRAAREGSRRRAHSELAATRRAARCVADTGARDAPLASGAARSRATPAGPGCARVCTRTADAAGRAARPTRRGARRLTRTIATAARGTARRITDTLPADTPLACATGRPGAASTGASGAEIGPGPTARTGAAIHATGHDARGLAGAVRTAAGGTGRCVADTLTGDASLPHPARHTGAASTGPASAGVSSAPARSAGRTAGATGGHARSLTHAAAATPRRTARRVADALA